MAAKTPSHARSAATVCAVVVVVSGCSRPASDGGALAATSAPSEGQTPASATSSLLRSGPRPASAPFCPRYRHEVAGLVADGRLIEASGLVASRRFPGVLYSHNDSGDGPRILALRTDGGSLGAYTLAGATAVDWEDLGLAPCPGLDRDCLYVGDIGGNLRPRHTLEVYQVPEPEAESGPEVRETLLHDAVKIVLRYPRGAYDSEAMLVDPRKRRLYIITKHLLGRSRVYGADLPEGTPRAAILLQEVATLGFGVPPLGSNPLVTGGAFSLDGSAFILKTYSTAFLWKLAQDERLETALARAPCPLPVPSEPQGEAICFAPQSDGYYTVSEGLHPPVHRFIPE